MSRFIVTSGSDFRPFSYDELIKPVKDSAAAHAAAADVYDQLSAETAALGRYISNNEGDVEARALYDNYMNRLGALQEGLWNNGFNAQTRRDLSTARTAYANDITRLQSAIQARQERSKEYWDARHKNPDLIMGYDPGVGGLDNYLRDSEYGRNWYSYSGNQFASEVGAEAKARAAELLDSYVGKANAPGYLEYIQKNGFTNAQVNEAGLLAQNVLSGRGSIEDASDPASALLAGVLISRLQATGANPGEGGNLSPEEFNRMFNYGMLGLSQGVGELNSKLIDDKIFDQQQKYAYAAYQHSLTNPKLPPDSDGPHREPVQNYLKSENADRLSKLSNKEFYSAFDNGPVSVKMPDGTFVTVADHADAMNKLLQNDARDRFMAMTGIDVAKKSHNLINSSSARQTGTYNGAQIRTSKGKRSDRQRLGLRSGESVIEQYNGGKWQVRDDLTQSFNEANNSFQAQVKLIDNMNGRGTVARLTTTPEEARKMRKKEGFSAGIPDSDLEYAVRAKYIDGDYYSVPIVQGPEDDHNRTRFANAIATMYRKLSGSGFNSKSSPYGFYKVEKGGTSIGDKNVLTEKNGLGEVFVLDKNGQIVPESIESISLLPNDINVKYDSQGNPVSDVRVRIVTPKGVFVTNIGNLGVDLDRAANGRVADQIATLMYPLRNGVDALDVNSRTSDKWSTEMYHILGDNYAPMYNGMLPTARAIVRNDNMKDDLLDGIYSYVSRIVANGLNPNALGAMQHIGYTSSKAEGIE